MNRIGSFVKWAGGKSQLIPELESRFPVGFGKEIKKYAEPFVGGGALLFFVLSKYDLEEVYINDINSELICTYKTIRDDVELLIDKLEQYQSDFLPLSDEGRKSFYYASRERFNALKRNGIQTVETAALFIFINRTCFNGLYRVNAKGDYNVPMGAYSNPRICDPLLLRADSEALRKVYINCGDYRDSDNFVDDKTLVYFDPPYRPLNITSSFNSYAKDEFNDDSQRELALYIRHLSDKRAYVLASNSDPRNTNPNDDFFDELYDGLYIDRVFAKRMINSKSSGRGDVTEIVVHNYPVVLPDEPVQPKLL